MNSGFERPSETYINNLRKNEFDCVMSCSYTTLRFVVPRTNKFFRVVHVYSEKLVGHITIDMFGICFLLPQGSLATPRIAVE